MASVSERGGRWYVRYRDASGKWVRQVSTADTKTPLGASPPSSSGVLSVSVSGSRSLRRKMAAALWLNSSSGGSTPIRRAALRTRAMCTA
jgi:hypothetical protein